MRYELRVPTHNELRDWGVPALELPGSTYGYQRLGDSEFTNQELDYPAIMRISVDELADCEQARADSFEGIISRYKMKGLVLGSWVCG